MHPILRAGLVLLATLPVACRTRRDDPPPPVDDVTFVAPPTELFTLEGEVFAVTPCCRKDDTLARARIPLDRLEKWKFEDLYLAEYVDGNLEPISFEREKGEIFADLRGGGLYVLLPIVARFVDTYRALCAFDRWVLVDEPRLIDPICTRILCSPEFFDAEVLYDEFPETQRYRDRLRFEEEPLLLGGFGGGGAGGNICDQCTGWRGTGHLYPSPNCFHRPPPPPPTGPKWDASVVNMIPVAESDEASQDSEPHLSIDEVDLDRMTGTAFTLSAPGNFAPLYVTMDGGNTWALSDVVNSITGTLDITVDSGADADDLYAGILRNPPAGPTVTDYRVQFAADFTAGATMTDLLQRNAPDQPWVDTLPAAADDRVYVAQNDMALRTGNGGSGRTASVDVSLDSGANFTSTVLEPRATGGQNAPSVRTVSAPNGRVYAAYFGWRSITANADGTFTITTDLVVARDDDGDPATTAFADLSDSADALAGQRVVTGRNVVFDFGGRIGQHRVGSTLALAVDPSDPDTVYLAWAEQDSSSDSSVHLRRSTDGGQTWSTDLRSIGNSLNIALAVTDDGTVGFLRQTLSATTPSRWVTVVEISESGTFTDTQFLGLCSTPSASPTVAGQPYLGDYAMLRAVRTGGTGGTGGTAEFRGVFSANNTPDFDNFPAGVTYQRNASFTTRLLSDGSGNNVPISIDPFYFQLVRR